MGCRAGGVALGAVQQRRSRLASMLAAGSQLGREVSAPLVLLCAQQILCIPQRSIYLIKALVQSMLLQHHNSYRDAFQCYVDFLIKM